MDCKVGGGARRADPIAIHILDLTIISVAVIVATFNASFSWERFLVKDLKAQIEGYASANHTSSEKLTDQQNPTFENNATSQFFKSASEQWEKNKVITNSLLGISVSTNDAPILSGISLSIVSIWFFFAMRRENHLIFGLLHDARTKSPDVKQRVFHGIASYLVFTTLSEHDQPYTDIDKYNVYPSVTRVLLRRTVNCLFYLPAGAVACATIIGILSLASPSPLRKSTDLLWYAIDLTEKVVASTQLVIAAVMIAIILFINIQIVDFANATRTILQQFRERYISGSNTDDIT